MGTVGEYVCLLGVIGDSPGNQQFVEVGFGVQVYFGSFFRQQEKLVISILGQPENRELFGRHRPYSSARSMKAVRKVPMGLSINVWAYLSALDLSSSSSTEML